MPKSSNKPSNQIVIKKSKRYYGDTKWSNALNNKNKAQLRVEDKLEAMALERELQSFGI